MSQLGDLSKEENGGDSGTLRLLSLAQPLTFSRTKRRERGFHLK